MSVEWPHGNPEKSKNVSHNLKYKWYNWVSVILWQEILYINNDMFDFNKDIFAL